MNQSDMEFLEELRGDFALEAEEHLETIVSGLLKLEKEKPLQESTFERIFRAAHSLKGAAHAVQLSQISSLCQSMESVFYAIKKNELVPDQKDYDKLQQATDILYKMLTSPDKEIIGVEEQKNLASILKKER